MAERKKRKTANQNRNDDYDEEAKMDKFYDLIKSTKQIRDYMSTADGSRGRRGNDCKKADQERRSSSGALWQPSFEPEDFGINKGSAAGCSSMDAKGRKHNDDGGGTLDLNLSL